MSRNLEAIRDALDYTRKVNGLLKSDLVFDTKLDYINKMLSRRDKALQGLASTEEQSDGIRRLIQALQTVDDENNLLMQAMLDEKRAEIEDIQLQKIDLVRQGNAQKKYIEPANEAGYYINNFK